MQRQALMSLATALALGSSGAVAQDGDLAGVTMRVLDDISGIDAVVLELGSDRRDEEGAQREGRAARDAEADGRERDGAPSRDDSEEDLEERRDGDEPSDRGDERNERGLEDREVERPATEQPPA